MNFVWRSSALTRATSNATVAHGRSTETMYFLTHALIAELLLRRTPAYMWSKDAYKTSHWKHRRIVSPAFVKLFLNVKLERLTLVLMPTVTFLHLDSIWTLFRCCNEWPSSVLLRSIGLIALVIIREAGKPRYLPKVTMNQPAYSITFSIKHRGLIIWLSFVYLIKAYIQDLKSFCIWMQRVVLSKPCKKCRLNQISAVSAFIYHECCPISRAEVKLWGPPWIWWERCVTRTLQRKCRFIGDVAEFL